MWNNRKSLILTTAVLLVVGLGCNGLPGIQTQAPSPPPTPATTPAPTATSELDNAKLMEKLEELEKKLDEAQKKGKTIAPPVIKGKDTMAWVNSPADGFLAMRSDPNADTGYRIMQIPHGANIRVLNCQSATHTISGRTGRWCRVSYGGSTGWAFDGWLVY